LAASLGGDDAAVARARAVESSGCASGAGQADYRAADPYNQAATAGKTAFVEKWNSQIAAVFGVRTFDQAQL
jgi:hypothetical protein